MFVVHDHADLDRVPDGAVLVTHATTPAFVPALRTVAAVVTEEGGVLSHAAMIARELKVPTIVGVQGVLSQLKDGDQIEVDAITGTIRKIS